MRGCPLVGGSIIGGSTVSYFQFILIIIESPFNCQNNYLYALLYNKELTACVYIHVYACL